MKDGIVCLMTSGPYKPGDPPPSGYMQWQEWARVQIKAGLRQARCEKCGLWEFPGEGCRKESS